MNKRILICYDALRTATGFKIVDEGTCQGPQSSQIYACYSCKNARTHFTNAVATPLWGVCIFGGARSGTAHSAVATQGVRLDEMGSSTIPALRQSLRQLRR